MHFGKQTYQHNFSVSEPLAYIHQCTWCIWVASAGRYRHFADTTQRRVEL